jgi:hypothetical protein
MSSSGLSDAALVARVAALVSKGHAVLATERYTGSAFFPGTYSVDRRRFSEWSAQSTHLLMGVLGVEHVYVKRFIASVRAALPADVLAGVGVLEAVHEDADLGLLRNVRSLLAAEVFTNFLDMAQHLLDEGYHVPAASLAGAVLEDGLRRVAGVKAVELKPMDGAGAISSRLAQAGAHNSLTQRQLGIAIEVRDHADHGRFDRISAADVAGMLRIVQAYLEANLTSAR